MVVGGGNLCKPRDADSKVQASSEGPGWEVVLKLPRKAGREQGKQLLPTVGPHSTKRAEPRTFRVPVQHTDEAKAVNLDNQIKSHRMV